MQKPIEEMWALAVTICIAACASVHAAFVTWTASQTAIVLDKHGVSLTRRNQRLWASAWSDTQGVSVQRSIFNGKHRTDLILESRCGRNRRIRVESPYIGEMNRLHGMLNDFSRAGCPVFSPFIGLLSDLRGAPPDDSHRVYDGDGVVQEVD
jgi:hypothetical protein